ncbi:hypothetical protein GCM10027061_23800 [Nesterenkonia suensis]
MVSLRGVSVRGVSVRGVSVRGVSVRGVSVRGFMESSSVGTVGPRLMPGASSPSVEDTRSENVPVMLQGGSREAPAAEL